MTATEAAFGPRVKPKKRKEIVKRIWSKEEVDSFFRNETESMKTPAPIFDLLPPMPTVEEIREFENDRDYGWTECNQWRLYSKTGDEQSLCQSCGEHYYFQYSASHPDECTECGSTNFSYYQELPF